MATCSKCGSQLAEGAKVCNACGAPVEAGVSTPSTPPLVSSVTPGPDQGGLAPNVAALLVYVPLCLIGLICVVLFGFVLDPYRKNRFIRFHAWQSLAVHVACLVLGIGWLICGALITAVIHFFAFIILPLNLLLGLASLGLMVFLMIKAYGNEAYKLPIVGDWAEQQANKV